METFEDGGFGQISIDPKDRTLIVKKFVTKKNGMQNPKPWDTNFLLQEAICTFYFTESEFIVKLMGVNLKEKYIKTQRWPYSLRQAFYKFKITDEQKLFIFRDILYGMSHMQSRSIIHADIKCSNILYNHEDNTVCICDLGLSSIVKYAKVDVCAVEYAPAPGTKSSNGNKVIGRDMFALCITGAEIFCNIVSKEGQQRTPAELRKLIRENKVIKNERIRAGLLMMVPDDLSKAPTAMDMLKFIYGETRDLPLPAVVKNPNKRICQEDLAFIQKTVFTIAEKYKIERPKRCFNSLVSFLNNPKRDPVNPKDYDMYISAALLIYSSLFSMPRLYIDRAFDLLSSGATREKFEEVVTIMATDVEFVNFTLNPHSK